MSAMKPSISAELENGIEDTPVFHWFIVFILFICLCFSLFGPWWTQAVPGLILLRVLAWHRAFFTRTTVKATDRVIEISRVTLLGRRTTVLDFDEIAQVRVQVKRWGRL